MIIGIDASRAYICDKTGTENYSFHVITQMLRLPEAKLHSFVLFTRPNAILPRELAGYDNVIVQEIRMKYLWTQVGLAMYTWRKFEIRNSKFELDRLWVPAHTLPVLRNPKIKTVVTIHGLEYQWLPEYKNLLQKWYLPLSTFYAAKSADRLIAVSKFTADELKKAVQNISNKINVIHEGVDFGQSEYSANQRISESNDQIYQRFGIEKKRYILFVGSVQPRKNLVALIEAFSQTDLDKLVIAGGIGWDCEAVLRAPNKFGVQEKVVFAGRVTQSELRSLYLGAEIYVQPSITEGFGLPILEAMSYGVPVIASDGGALREVVGNAGLVVPLENPKPSFAESYGRAQQISNSKIQVGFVDRLASAMERVVADKKLQNSLISMGYKRVVTLSWSVAAKKTLLVLTG